MAFFLNQYIPTGDWCNQDTEAFADEPRDSAYSNTCTSQHSMRQQAHECDPGSFTSTRVNGTSQSMPFPWHNSMPTTMDPTTACHPHPYSQFQGFQSEVVPAASLPPAAFTKYPSPIDQFSITSMPAVDNSNVNAFYTREQPLPVSDVPALDHESTSTDEAACGRDMWLDSPVMKVEAEDDNTTAASLDMGDVSENADPCYAELLRQALMEADNHTMLLKDLYDWVRTHSAKAQDPTNKGWQNSVRHNLSMNAAFERVPPVGLEAGTKKTSYWRLTRHAVKYGIKSTTRYRKDSKRKSQRNPNPAPSRVLSGAKGGQATRRSARRQPVTTPLGGMHASSGLSRQRSFRESHPMHRYPVDRLHATPTHQRVFVAPGSSPFFEDAADFADSVPNPYSLDSRTEQSHEFLAPYGTAFADWSLSPSPLGHFGNEFGWLNNPKNAGLQ